MLATGRSHQPVFGLRKGPSNLRPSGPNSNGVPRRRLLRCHSWAAEPGCSWLLEAFTAWGHCDQDRRHRRLRHALPLRLKFGPEINGEIWKVWLQLGSPNEICSCEYLQMLLPCTCMNMRTSHNNTHHRSRNLMGLPDVHRSVYNLVPRVSCCCLLRGVDNWTYHMSHMSNERSTSRLSRSSSPVRMEIQQPWNTFETAKHVENILKTLVTSGHYILSISCLSSTIIYIPTSAWHG